MSRAQTSVRRPYAVNCSQCGRLLKQNTVTATNDDGKPICAGTCRNSSGSRRPTVVKDNGMLFTDEQRRERIQKARRRRRRAVTG